MALGALAACIAPPATPPMDREASWPEAVQLLQRCKVDSVFQLHDRTVSLTLKDGSTVTTIEPHLDAVIYPDVMPPRCGDVGIIME